jgi:SAM-dependent methyltransferase
MVEFSNPAAYERWMGRWSRRLAPSFVDFAELPRGARLLDVGSGTAALSLALLEGVPGASVVGIEPAAAYVSYCRKKISHDRLRFETGDAQALPLANKSFDATLSLLILQELSDARLALREMCRVTRPGGAVVASQWDFAKGMPMLALFWDTVHEVVGTKDAREAAADCMVVDYPDGVGLQDLWQAAGLIEIRIERLEIDMAFASFEDYWAPFLSNVTATSSFATTLAANDVAEIEHRLRQRTLGEAPDGPFSLKAYAWAVGGKLPD